MLNKINQIINPLYLDYIVVNHMELEPDSMETFLEEDKILFSNVDSGSI
jgi:flavorubredoxin